MRTRLPIAIVTFVLGAPAYAEESETPRDGSSPPVAAGLPTAPTAEHVDAQRGADNGDLHSDLDELESLLGTIVTSSRTVKALLEIDRSASKVTDTTLRESHATSVPDLLAETPGVFIQKTNRSAGAPIIRGFIGPQNLLLIDGVRLNTSTYRTGPLQYLNITDPFAFDRVEVLRGPGSALYGSDAFGGVVQMLTPAVDFSRPFRTRSTVGFGSADSSTLAAVEARGSSGRFGGLGGITYEESGNLRAGRGHDVPLSGNRHVSGHAKVGFELRKDWDLQAAYLVTRVDDAGRIDKLHVADYRLTDNTDHLAYARVRYQGRGSLKEVVANVSYQRLEERVDHFKCTTDAVGIVEDLRGCIAASTVRPGHETALSEKRISQDAVDVVGAFATADLSFLGGDLAISAGGETYFELIYSHKRRAASDTGFAFEDEDGTYPEGSQFRSMGAFLFGTYTPWRFADAWQLTLTGGLRVTNARARASDVDEFGGISSGFTGLVGTAGFIVTDPETLAFYGNFSQGFRAPNLQESLAVGNTGSNFEIGNPALSAERVDTFEGGAKLHLDALSCSAAYFVSLLSDVIAREDATFEGQSEVDGVPVKRRVNADGGLYHGAEVSAQARWWRLETTASGTWMTGDIGSSGEREPARRVPPFFYDVGLRYDHDDGSFYGEVFVRGATQQDRLSPGDESDLRMCEDRSSPGTLREPCNRTAGWATLNVRAGSRITEKLWLDVALLNLTDERYRPHGSGFDFPGVSTHVSLTYSD